MYILISWGRKLKTLIIIPAYNEEASILRVIERIEEVTDCDYLVVNDGSTDNTKKVLLENNKNFIDLPINLGIGGAVGTGYKYAHNNGYDFVVQIDGDGQHDPAFIKTMRDIIIDGKADMVIGSRFIEKQGFQTSAMRRAGIKFLKFLIKILCGKTITDATSGFRVTNKEVTAMFASYYPDDYPEPETTVMALKRGYRILEHPVVMHDRTGGVSSINALRSIYFMIKVSLAMILMTLKPKPKVKK